MDGILRMKGMRGDFDEERIIVRGDDSAGVSRAGIETDARSAAGTIGDDLTGIRHEIVLRIFRGDTALDRNAFVPDLILLANGDLRPVKSIALSDEDLALYDIHIGDHFRDGVFDLDTRIDFDEIEVLFILIDQEFDRAGIHIVDILHQFDSCIADVLSECLRKRPCRRHFDDLLVTALDGAVTFEEMHHIAVLITHDLHFDMLRVHDAAFDIDFIITESHLRFGTRTVVRFFQIFHAVDISHAASAAAIDGFDHDRESVGFCESLHFIKAVNRTLGPRDHRDLRFFCLNAGIHLVTEHNEMFDLRPDENDAFFFAALSELRIFSKEAVARMNGIDVMFLTDTDDIFDVKVCVDRLIPFTDQVGFICTVSVQGQDIFFRIDSHGADAHFTAGSEYADRDLAAVGYQYFMDSSHEILPLNKIE